MNRLAFIRTPFQTLSVGWSILTLAKENVIEWRRPWQVPDRSLS